MQYEPTIEELRHKYEVAMKEKMLVRLEKERLQARTEALEAQVGPPTPSTLPHACCLSFQALLCLDCQKSPLMIIKEPIKFQIAVPGDF